LRRSSASTEPLDAGSEEASKWTQVVDTGDGEIRTTWEAAECKVAIEASGRASMPPLELEPAERCRCFRISGIDTSM